MRYFLLLSFVCFEFASTASAQQLEIPRRHDRPPGQAISAEEAAARMTVPEGFTVEVVAAEPDVVNPVAMCIDEKGRFWITESFEYPRREPGPGRDRIKVLEDTDCDGKVDKVTVFAEGLNIPSGIAVGYGGVWVVNAPDLLFMQDTDGDGKADKTEVIVTGFGRTDTHELPNSLTWGPDGWLYGLNGVFNYCHVKYPTTNPNYQSDQKSIDFTCALFRIHPRTKKFEIYAEGTSNPWGIAINNEGDFFVSACVIDHLWHIAESGYYIRQGGPYPPHTWPIRSIVNHKHQKAAYCGITWFDSDVYPPEYRNVLYMGNIHGGSINADLIERNGATYKGKPHPGFPAKPGAWDHDQYDTIAKTGDPKNPRLADFLTANDAWFMPVVQKTGPDGSLYILDWYDRYHCYQDANADPAGIDRSKGRLYRVRYRDTPHSQPFDLNKKGNQELTELLLKGRNEYERETAQRLLVERLGANHDLSTVTYLNKVVQDRSLSVSSRLRATWVLGSAGRFEQESLVTDDPTLFRWTVRFASSSNEFSWSAMTGLLDRLNAEQNSSLSPQVAMQLALLAMDETRSDQGMKSLLNLAAEYPGDPLIPQISWQNLKSALLKDATPFPQILTSVIEQHGISPIAPLVTRSVNVICDTPQIPPQTLADVLKIVQIQPDQDALQKECLAILAERVKQKSLSPEKVAACREFISWARGMAALRHRATILDGIWGDAGAQEELRQFFGDISRPIPDRLEALQALVASGDHSVLEVAAKSLSTRKTPRDFRTGIIESIGRLNHAEVGAVLLGSLSSLEPDLSPRVIEVLTQRPVWSLALFNEIEAGKIDKSLVNLNQLMRVNNFKNEELQKQLARIYGAIRTNARSDRQGVINKHRDFLHGTPGDPVAGVAVYKRVCAQCHKIYGEGEEVGPDITRNGRNNWDQLLQNIFDPSAVIGPGYQARMIATDDGRVLTGLPVEDTSEKVVLKIQGGKLETIPRDQIEADKLSELSMMPEDLEKLMTPQELADLFAFLALDKPPHDPDARILSGAPAQKRRSK
ncbi:MAG TPA: PVC-type heme-binding CxxCH protein [Planctomicrobium sp.]|nr:PVC-type heme-binding CxxCH protein [Planctomicrobium sp.]